MQISNNNIHHNVIVLNYKEQKNYFDSFITYYKWSW